MPRTLATLPRQYRGSWSASIDDRVVCRSVRWPFCLPPRPSSRKATSRRTETRPLPTTRAGTIVAVRGEIGTLAALTGEAATPGRPVAARNRPVWRRSRARGRDLTAFQRTPAEGG